MEPIENKVDYLESDVQSTPPLTADTTITPSVTIENTKYAGFWIRLVAYLLDGLVLAIPILAINLGLLFLSKGSFPYISYLARAIDFLITYTYFVWMTFKYQATLGKMAVGLVVVSDKSSTLTSGQVLLREISKVLSALILYLGYIMAGFTKRKQSLHDMIASTTVIYKEPKKKFGAKEITAISVASILPALLAFGIIIWLILAGLIAAKNKAKMTQNNSMTVQNNPSIDDDSFIKANMISVIASAQNPINAGKSLEGITDPVKIDCSGDPTINLSPDKLQMAIFRHSCQNPEIYYCLDTSSAQPYDDDIKQVDKNYVESGAYLCSTPHTNGDIAQKRKIYNSLVDCLKSENKCVTIYRDNSIGNYYVGLGQVKEGEEFTSDYDIDGSGKANALDKIGDSFCESGLRAVRDPMVNCYCYICTK